MKISLLCVFIVCAMPGASLRADTVLLKDGTRREGTVVGRTADEVLLRIDEGGLQATISIATKDIDSVEMTPKGAGPASQPAAARAAPSGIPPAGPAASQAAQGSSPTTPSSAATAGPAGGAASGPASRPAIALPPTGGFLKELAASAIGLGPDNPARLSQDLPTLFADAVLGMVGRPPRKQGSQELQTLIADAVRHDTLHNYAEALKSLRELDDVFSPQAGGSSRLDGICERVHKETFGLWLARVHYEAMAAKLTVGPLDLSEVRDVERPALVGILKEKTGPALDPLRSYFPPVDDKTGRPGPFRPAQLQGITLSNALEVRKEAALASAILLAQMKLEPQMAPSDRLLLTTQLQCVQRILSRATQLEPAARAAAEKAERERRANEARNGAKTQRAGG